MALGVLGLIIGLTPVVATAAVFGTDERTPVPQSLRSVDRQDRNDPRSPLPLGVHRLLRRARYGGDRRALPLSAPPTRRRCISTTSPSACTAAARRATLRAPTGALPMPTCSPARPTSTCARPSMRRATGRWCDWRKPLCTAGALKISPRRVEDVMRLSAKGPRLQHRLPPRSAEVAADARAPLPRQARLRRRAVEDDPPRLLRSRPAPPAHVRHGRRLVRLAVARRWCAMAPRSSALTWAPTCSRRSSCSTARSCTASSRTTSPIPASTRRPSQTRLPPSATPTSWQARAMY